MPLCVWLAGAWYLTNQKLGVSALGLQRVLGLGSYQTAWTMLHRLQKAMVRPDRELLHGQVEGDETDLAVSNKRIGCLPGLSSLGYAHERIVMSGSEVVAHVSMPGVHRVASVVNR